MSDSVDFLSSAMQDTLLQLRFRVTLLELELEKAKMVSLQAERRAELALQAETKAERELEQAIEITIETSRAAEDAIHAQMEAEQRAELAIVEAERAKQAQHAAEMTAETALIEAEAMRKRLKQIGLQAHREIAPLGLTDAASSDTCSLGPAEALELSRPSNDDADRFPLPNDPLPSSTKGGQARQVINEHTLAFMRENAARREHSATFKHIVSGSTLAACGAGLNVMALSCGFDNGFVQIYNLPFNMEADHIASLFSSADTPFIITDTSQCGNGTLNATVLVKAGRKQTVVDQIHGKTIRGRVLRATVVGAKCIAQLRAPHYELQLTWEPRPNDSFSSNINIELGRLLESSPGLICFQFTACGPTGTYTAATAEFDSWSSAKKTHVLLEQLGLQQSFPSIRYDLRPNQPTQHILRIPLDQHYLFEDDDSAKNRRMSITEEQGAIVRTDYLGFDWFDGWLWSFDLTAKELMEQMLSRKDTGIYRITRDWLSRMLTFHAESQKAIDAVATAIREAVARSKLAKYRTRISRQLVRSLQDSDILDTLHAEPGVGTVSLDMMCSHYVLKYRGGNAADMIDKLATGTHSDEAEEKVSCPICLAEVVQPIELGCGHEYCAACLRGYLITAPERNRFPITCIGNDDTCRRPVAIPIIQTVLSIPQFHHLVDRATSSYVDQHPNELRYCPTPGCTQIYRRNKDKNGLTCPSCLTSVCSTCNSKGHPGRTCPEQRACTDPNEQERLDSIWASRNGAKGCPSCHVWIQKTTGCNHMHCRMCNAHICWLCLAKYKTAKDVYEHLREIHGSISVPPVNGLDQDLQLAHQLQMHEVVRANQVQTTLGMRDIVQRENVYGRQLRERDSCIIM